MVAPMPDAGLFSRLVRRLSIWLQPRAPRQCADFPRFRQRSDWFRPRFVMSAKALKTRAKRQDLVRRREFEHLRSLRASAIWPPSGMDAPAALARAQTLQKIDAIEALMTHQKPGGGLNRPAGSGQTPSNPLALAPVEGEGADDGATRIGAASDLLSAKPPKSGPA